MIGRMLPLQLGNYGRRAGGCERAKISALILCNVCVTYSHQSEVDMFEVLSVSSID